MATHVPPVRQPFAPLNSSRLQQLASAKNKQNGIFAQNPILGGKASASVHKNSPFSSKRTFSTTSFEDLDGENVDPEIHDSPSKKTKGAVSDASVKPPMFTLTSTKSSMLPPASIPSRLSTPAKANTSSPRAPLTAPAGRSPTRKMAGIGKSRRTSAPFGRANRPFGSHGSSDAALPFSLDAALSGTLASAKSKASLGLGAGIRESMPSSWYFDIHEDTPEEEAANLMEHSTLTLDLSSDEESSIREKRDVGKENMPPEGYDARTASRDRSSIAPSVDDTTAPKLHKSDLLRKKTLVSDAMDDGQRSPLSDLEAEPFFSEGLDKDSHVVVDEDVAAAEPSNETAVSDGSPLPKVVTAGPKTSASKKASFSEKESEAVASADPHDFAVWEDDAGDDVVTESAHCESDDMKSAAKDVTVAADENAFPASEIDVV